MHVIFGHVVSGHDMVRQLEQLPVDRNSRPLQDAIISNCGELVRQMKSENNINQINIIGLIIKLIFVVKKHKSKKKKQRRETTLSESSSESSTSAKSNKEKKRKKRKTKIKSEKDSSNEGTVHSIEEESDNKSKKTVEVVPTKSKVNPDEIPETPQNKFLMRGVRSNEFSADTKKERDRNRSDNDRKPY